MKKIILIITLSLITATTYSQTPAWQWIKNGGSGGSSSNMNLKESCRDIQTDANGNIYGISSIFNVGIVIDTIQKNYSYGYEDFCVFSYSCEGNFRWVRFFGSTLPDKPGGISVDEDGNVYVTGMVAAGSSGDAHYGDTIIPQTAYQMNESSFIAKLDSIGHIVWLNLPDLTYNNTPKIIQNIESDNQGNLCVLVKFLGATYWDSIPVPTKGWYMAKFNKLNGTLMTINKLEYQTTYDNVSGIFFTIDNDNTIYMMSEVADTLFVGNDTVVSDYYNAEHTKIIAKFNPIGQNIWYKVVRGTQGSTTDYYQAIWGKPVIFGNSVFIGGETQSYPGSNFLGVPIVNSFAFSSTDKTKIIAKFNKNTGNFITANNLKNKDYIALWGFHLGKTDSSIIAAGAGGILIGMNQSDTIKPFPSTFRSYPFVVEIDTGLTHFNWGVATVGKGQPLIEAITVDKNGNIYIAGNMNDSLYNSFGVGTPNAAGNEDFFIAKVALTNDSCGCAESVPSLSLVGSTANTLTVNGSATNMPDSLYIIWGDGDSTLYSNPNSDISHTYATSGPWNVCLKSYSYCGDKIICLNNLYSGITSTSLSEFDVNIYPNPFNQTLSIIYNQTLKNEEVYIYDLLGKEVLKQKLTDVKTTINTSVLENGIYLLKVVSEEGNVYVGKVVKNN